MEESSVKGAVITFFSTASAVGKTLIGINMASELAREGWRVCLVDYDLQFGDVTSYLKLAPTQSIADLQRAMMNPMGNYQLQDYLTPYTYQNVGFSVLTSPAKLEDAYNIEPEYAVRAIKELQTQFQYIIIDTTSMFSRLNLQLMQLSTIVTFLGVVDFLPTIKNMKIGRDTLNKQKLDKHKVRLVLNRSDSKTRIGIDDVEKLLGEPFYHILPNDFRAASQSIRDGVPLVFRDAGGVSKLSSALRDLVMRYTNRSGRAEVAMAQAEADANHQQEGWFSRLFH